MNLQKSQIKYLLVLALVAVTLPMAAWLASRPQLVQKQAACAVNLKLTPASGSYAKNAAFSVNLQVEAGAAHVAGANVNFSFTAGKLKVNAITLPSVVNSEIIKNINNTTGNVQILAVDSTGTGATGTFNLATIQFEGLTVGSTAEAVILGSAEITAMGEGAACSVGTKTNGAYTITVAPTATNTPIPGATNTPIPSAGCQAVDRIINVTPIGGSGTCHDLQQAVDAANAGDKIEVKNGTYQLTPFICTLPWATEAKRCGLIIAGSLKNGLNIVGEGKNTVLNVNVAEYGVAVKDTRDVIIENLKITGGAGNYSALGVYNSINISLSKNLIEGNDAHGIFVKDSTGARVVENILKDGSVVGIQFVNSQGKILSNILDLGIQTVDGIMAYSNSNVDIINNTIINGHHGIELGEPNETRTQAVIKNNIIASNYNRGIFNNNKNSGPTPLATIDYNDVWSNTLGNYDGFSAGAHDISVDPQWSSAVPYCPTNPVLKTAGEGEAFVGALDPSSCSGGAEKVINFKVKLKGVDGQPTVEANRTLSFTLLWLVGGPNGSQNATEPVPATVDGNGVWTLRTSWFSLLPGQYDVYIKGPKHLQKKVSRTKVNIMDVAEQTLDFVQNGERYYLEPGDLPISGTNKDQQDGVVNSLDAVYLTGCFTTPDDATCLAKADLNLDGIINTMDMELLNGTVYSKWEDEVN